MLFNLLRNKGFGLILVLSLVTVLGIGATMYMKKINLTTSIFVNDIGGRNKKYLDIETDFIFSRDINCLASLGDIQSDGTTGAGAVTFSSASELNQGIPIDLWLGNINGERTRKKFSNPGVGAVPNPEPCTGNGGADCEEQETSHIFGKLNIESLVIRADITSSDLVLGGGSFDAEIILKGKRRGLNGIEVDFKEIKIEKEVFYNYSDTGSGPVYTLSGCGAVAPGVVDGVCQDYGVIPLPNDPATDDQTGCVSGSFSDGLNIATEWQWDCLGTGGTDVSCTAPRITCVDNGSTVVEGGSVNLCCNGVGAGGFIPPNETQLVCNNTGSGSNNPGDPCTCGVSAAVDGVCTTFTGPYDSQPAFSMGAITSGCTIGNYQNLPDTATEWVWECQGSNGGAGVSCTADKSIPGGDGCIGTYNYTYITGGSCNGSMTDAVAAQTSTVGMCMYIYQDTFGIPYMPHLGTFCASRQNQAECINHCSWGTMSMTTPASPSRPCSDINNVPNGGYNFMTGQMLPTREYVCNSNSNCTWTLLTESNTRVCSDFYTAGTCNAQSGCNWGASSTPPDTNWQIGMWGGCSVSCGAGLQTRTVTCPAGYNCPLAPPANSRACNGSGCGGKVICGELFRQGYMSYQTILADNLYANKNISEKTLKLYQAWAKPFVYMMQRSKLVTEIVRPYGVAWAEHMAYLEGSGQKSNYLGYLLHSNFLPLHDWISGAKSKTVAYKKPNFELRGAFLFLLLVACIFSLLMLMISPLIVGGYRLTRKK